MHYLYLSTSTFVASFHLNMTPRVLLHGTGTMCLYLCTDQTKPNQIEPNRTEREQTRPSRSEPDELCVSQGSGGRSFVWPRMLKVLV